MASSSLQALTRATLLLLAVAAVLLVAPHACTASNTNNKTLLEDRCESYAGGDKSSYNYCVRTLRRDGGRSATADSLGLAAIAARIARATAKATAAKIATNNETASPAVAACAGEYAAAVRRLGHAAAAAARSNGDVGHAQTLLAEAAGTPARCQAAFVAAGEPSPLAEEDFGLDDQIELAIAILPPQLTTTRPRTTPPPDSSSQRGGGGDGN